MINTISIQKLTAPQLTALRETFPACVEAGVLTTTRSVATFTLPEDYTGPVEIDSASLFRSIAGRFQPAQYQGVSVPVGVPAPLNKVLAKLDDPQQAHVRAAHV